MPYYYKFNSETKQAKTYTEVIPVVLEYSRDHPAEAIYLYHPVGSEPQELKSALEHGYGRIQAGHPAHIIATNGEKSVWEVIIWTE